MERVDVVVIGAGVIGLAVARALALAGREVLILEREDTIGTGTSSRNSEVVHGGLYYPAGSLKARLCVAGRRALYAFCVERGIAHRRCGKLVVATDEAQEPALAAIAERGRRNGVESLSWLDEPAVRALEPDLACTRALLSPETGIIDSHGLMMALLGEAEQAGASLVVRSPVNGADARGEDGGIAVAVGGADPVRVLARAVVNAAGLGAPALAERMAGLPRRAIPTGRLAKGTYFTLVGRTPFRHLVYPIPEPGGLGIHLTLDLQGRARFGPDVEWVDAVDYTVDPGRGERFAAAIRRYWPGLPDGALAPGYAGIRPKIGGPDDPPADFRIDGPAVHGIPGLVNLFGLESPGLTACLAVADGVAAMVGQTRRQS